MKVSLYSIEKPLLEDFEANSIHYTSENGEHEVLDDHSDFRGLIASGRLTIRNKDDVHYYTLQNGLIEVLNNVVKIESTTLYSIQDERRTKFLSQLGSIESQLQNELLSSEDYETHYQKALFLGAFKE